jgi:hypothetical protein
MAANLKAGSSSSIAACAQFGNVAAANALRIVLFATSILVEIWNSCSKWLAMPRLELF